MEHTPQTQPPTSADLQVGKVHIASTQEVISTFSHLIEVCQTSEESFRAAARAAASQKLRAMLYYLARQRGDFQEVLRAEIRWLGGEPREALNKTGLLYRDWVNIQSAGNGGGDASLIGECVRREQLTLRAYQEVLGDGLPRFQHALIEQQFARIREAYERIQSLEKTAGK